jgi:MtN3 and saliva related transmembrane protein
MIALITTQAELIGSLAGMLTTAAFLPQVWQIWKTRSTKDISLGMYIIFTSGVMLWLLYGTLIGSFPIIVANAVTLVCAFLILAMKYRYG